MKFLRRLFFVLIFGLLVWSSEKTFAETAGDKKIEKTIENLGLKNEKVKISSEVRYSDSETIDYTINEVSTLSFKKDGSLLRMSRVNELDLSKDGTDLNEVRKSDILNSLRNIVPEDFTLREEQDMLGGEGTKFVFSNDKNGIENKYNVVIVTVENSTGRIISYKRVEEFTEEINPSISEEEAKKLSNEYLSNIGKNLEIKSVKLSIDKVVGKDDSKPVLLYKVKYENDSELWVNALNGKIEFVNELKKEGNSFYSTKYDDVGYCDFHNATRLREILAILGYKSHRTPYSAASVRDYLKGYYSYAFTFSGHGSATSIADNKGERNTISDVSGVWNFVFLDSCSSAATTDWSDAFKIYNGSSNRIFMGWYEGVYPSVSRNFCMYLNTCVKRNSSISFYKNVWNAFEEGDDYYPLRFRGDKSWNGKI